MAARRLRSFLVNFLCSGDDDDDDDDVPAPLRLGGPALDFRGDGFLCGFDFGWVELLLLLLMFFLFACLLLCGVADLVALFGSLSPPPTNDAVLNVFGRLDVECLSCRFLAFAFLFLS